jgi:transcriptional regulator with XRE-family HTH domain
MPKLKEIRLKKFLSQPELSKMTKMAVSTINRIEQGKQMPQLRTIRKLANALGVQPEEIEFPIEK